MLSEKIEKALNEQIAQEALAADYYLALAGWCAQNGRPGAAKFMYAQSDEERAHMLKLFHYVGDSGGKARVAVTKALGADFKSIADVFDFAREHERKVTRSIHQLVDLCLTTKDYGTFHFLQWYVAEQQEEERMMGAICDMIGLAGKDARGEFFIDREIANLPRPAN